MISERDAGRDIFVDIFVYSYAYQFILLDSICNKTRRY